MFAKIQANEYSGVQTPDPPPPPSTDPNRPNCTGDLIKSRLSKMVEESPITGKSVQSRSLRMAQRDLNRDFGYLEIALKQKQQLDSKAYVEDWTNNMSTYHAVVKHIFPKNQFCVILFDRC